VETQTIHLPFAGDPGCQPAMGTSARQIGCARTDIHALYPQYHTIPIVISESKLLSTITDYGIVRGNVMNTGIQPVYDVTVQADFFDNSGRFVISSTGHTVFTPTLSMQRNPFEVGSMPVKFEYIGGYTTRIISWTKGSSSEFLPLTVVYSNTTGSSGYDLSVVALFRNDNPVVLKNVVLYAWSLDQYFPFGTSRLKDPIAPGETISYTKDIFYGSLPIYIFGRGSVDP